MLVVIPTEDVELACECGCKLWRIVHKRPLPAKLDDETLERTADRIQSLEVRCRGCNRFYWLKMTEPELTWDSSAPKGWPEK